jgi:hypothetical protein
MDGRRETPDRLRGSGEAVGEEERKGIGTSKITNPNTDPIGVIEELLIAVGGA